MFQCVRRGIIYPQLWMHRNVWRVKKIVSWSSRTEPWRATLVAMLKEEITLQDVVQLVKITAVRRNICNSRSDKLVTAKYNPLKAKHIKRCFTISKFIGSMKGLAPQSSAPC